MLPLEVLEHVVGADFPAFVDGMEQFGFEPKDAQAWFLVVLQGMRAITVKSEPGAVATGSRDNARSN